MKKRTIDLLIVILVLLLVVINAFAIDWPAPPPSPDVSGLTGGSATPTPTATSAPPTFGAPSLPGAATPSPTPTSAPPPFGAPSLPGTTTPTPTASAAPTSAPPPFGAPSLPGTTTPAPSFQFPAPPTTPSVPGATPSPTKERIIEKIIERQLPGPERIIEKPVSVPDESKDVRDVLRSIIRDRRGTQIPLPIITTTPAGPPAPNLEHIEIMTKIERQDNKLESLKDSIKNAIAQELIGVKSAIAESNNNINSIKNSIDSLKADIKEEIAEVPKRIEIPSPPDIAPIRKITISSLITIIISALLIIAILVLFIIKIFRTEEHNVEELKEYFKTELSAGGEEETLKNEATKIGWTKKEIDTAIKQAKEEVESEAPEEVSGELPEVPELPA